MLFSPFWNIHKFFLSRKLGSEIDFFIFFLIMLLLNWTLLSFPLLFNLLLKLIILLISFWNISDSMLLFIYDDDVSPYNDILLRINPLDVEFIDVMLSSPICFPIFLLLKGALKLILFFVDKL